jgi:hypothetical protein
VAETRERKIIATEQFRRSGLTRLIYNRRNVAHSRSSEPLGVSIYRFGQYRTIPLEVLNLVMNSSMIIGIPGAWIDRSVITTSIARTHKFVFAGMLLMDIQTQASCGLEIYDYDPNMRKSFEIAGQGRISDEVLQKIADHRHTLYAICDSPSIETATWMLEAGVGLLSAGGLAIKVESAGLAHTAEDWQALAADRSPAALYQAFVTLLSSDNYYYSCGMHNFGLPDVSLSHQVEPQTASQILNEFNYYQLVEQPSFVDGHTFSTALEAPRFKLLRCSYEGFDYSDPLYNPFGRWHLESL